MKIVTTPHPVLSTPALPVKNIDKTTLTLISEMIKTLGKQTDPPGVGLAAPQVGKPLRIFVIQKNLNDKPKIFINPVILESKNIKSAKASKNAGIKLEGCLSIRRIWGSVKRYDKILVSYKNEDGVEKKEWFTGFMSVIIQHEIDHLEGILFTKRVMEQSGDLYEEKKGELYKIKNLL